MPSGDSGDSVQKNEQSVWPGLGGYNCGKHTEDDRFGKKLKLGLDLGSKLLGLL